MGYEREELMWYLDCFCHGALGGRNFPVNNYSHESLRRIVSTAEMVLGSDVAGIDEVRIARRSLGMNVRPLESEDALHRDPQGQ